MEDLITNKTVSLTELRDPGAVIRKTGGKPVAVLNRNKLVGYFVPAAAVEKVSFEAASHDEVLSAMDKRKAVLTPTLDYLKDK